MRYLVFLMLLWAGAARADGEKAGDFDYYVLSLSWSSSWCLEVGDDRGDPQCDRTLGFVLHGLWPQYEGGGWPSWCRTPQRDATRAETAAMGDLMAPSLAWHEWKAHGRCSGLSAAEYFAAARKAFAGLKMPPVLSRVRAPLKMPPSVLLEAFAEVNPDLPEGALTLSCGEGRVEELRMCLTRDLQPRACGTDVQACSLPSVTLPPLR